MTNTDDTKNRDSDTITFEQPLHEHLRLCLRLEHLFAKTEHLMQNLDSKWAVNELLHTILDLLDVTDRPDIKSKLVTAVRLHKDALTQLQLSPDIDMPKLRQILRQLEQAGKTLHETHGKLGQELRGNEFLNSIRQRINTPAGISDFAIPAYHLWLQQSPQILLPELRKWLAPFKLLRELASLLLQLTRDSATPTQQIAPNGFYQESLATNIAYQMIRVTIPSRLQIYPEISVGRHRLSIHFYAFDINSRATQVTNDATFALTLCKI